MNRFKKFFQNFSLTILCFAEPSLYFSSRIRTLADGVRARCLTAWRRRMVSVEGFEPPNGGVRARCLNRLAKPKSRQDTYRSKVGRYSCCLCLYYNNYITFFSKSKIIEFSRSTNDKYILYILHNQSTFRVLLSQSMHRSGKSQYSSLL